MAIAAGGLPIDAVLESLCLVPYRSVPAAAISAFITGHDRAISAPSKHQSKE
jgi:hypothetical protein